MITIVLGILFFIIALPLIPIAISFKNGERKFQENCIKCDGILVGYVRQDYNKWDIPQVSIQINGKEVICRCKSKNMSASTYPHGTIVKIAYYKKRMFGIESYDVRMVDPKYSPYPTSITLIVLVIFGFVFITIAVILIIIGLNSI